MSASTHTHPGGAPRKRGAGDAEGRLLQAAREATEAGASIEDSAAILVKMAASSAALRDILIRKGAQAVSYQARSMMRQASIKSPTLPATKPSVWAPDHRAAERMHRARQVLARDIYSEWILPGTNIRLGDATLADLAAARDYHYAKAAGDKARGEQYNRLFLLLKDAKKKTLRDGVAMHDAARVLKEAVQ